MSNWPPDPKPKRRASDNWPPIDRREPYWWRTKKNEEKFQKCTVTELVMFYFVMAASIGGLVAMIYALVSYRLS